ncbi:YopX family protein [Bacillus subtilis]|uniref:YopX family protein n=1 Tax=Bacillus subtilis TaxID=1423 RepID=UPI0029390583|nr:YopX family protein [Bacillus subtilis]WNA14214.1 hypothetical protein phi182_46 [Bacillus phage phi18-2]WOF29660.1 YopX family protein [Bacillus subtilis]
MREIKFRKWDFEEGEMIPGEALAFEEYAPLTDLLTQEGIMQYTGLKDTNGRDIYEGDIVLYDRNISTAIDSIMYVVRWEECKFVLLVMDNPDDIIDDFDGDLIEVIGDVYRNPELLELSVEHRTKPEYNGWKLSNVVDQRILETENCLTNKIESAVTSHVEFLESEYKKAFEHFNVPINEVPSRAKVVRNVVDRSEELHIDDIPVFVAYEPKVTSDNLFEHSVVFEFKRLYEEVSE